MIMVVFFSSIPVMAAYPDDYGNSFEKAQQVPLPMRGLSGQINYLGDEDYFKIIPLSTGKLNASLRSYAVESIEMELYNEKGSKISSDRILSSGKAYYIVVKSRGEKTGSYTLDLIFDTNVTIDDYTVLFEEAIEIDVPIREYSGYLSSANDTNCIKLIAPDNGKLIWESEDRIQVKVYDENGNIIDRDTYLEAGHTYYLIITADRQMFYDLDLYMERTETQDAAYGNSFNTAIRINALPINNLERYTDSKGTKDYYKFTVPFDGKLDVEGYVEFELYDENQNPISKHSILRTGRTYYIVLYGYEQYGGHYSVNIDVIKDDYGNNFEEAEEISISTIIKGRIDYVGDDDYFKFTVPTECLPWYSLKSGNPGVVLYDENFKEITVRDVCKAGHTYYVQFFGASVENYSFTIECDPLLLYGDVNGDQQVNSIDFGIMKKVLLGMDISNMTFDKVAADLDGDGAFTSNDYAALNQYLLGKRKTFPVDTNGDGYIND